MADNGFGTRVHQARLNLSARKGRSVTQIEVGKALKVTSATVGRWEAGLKEPSLDTIAALAKVLQVDPCYLAFGTGITRISGPELGGGGQSGGAHGGGEDSGPQKRPAGGRGR